MAEVILSKEGHLYQELIIKSDSLISPDLLIKWGFDFRTLYPEPSSAIFITPGGSNAILRLQDMSNGVLLDERKCSATGTYEIGLGVHTLKFGINKINIEVFNRIPRPQLIFNLARNLVDPNSEAQIIETTGSVGEFMFQKGVILIAKCLDHKVMVSLKTPTEHSVVIDETQLLAGVELSLKPNTYHTLSIIYITNSTAVEGAVLHVKN